MSTRHQHRTAGQGLLSSPATAPAPASGAAQTHPLVRWGSGEVRKEGSELMALRSAFTEEETRGDRICLKLTRLAFLLSGRMGLKKEVKFIYTKVMKMTFPPYMPMCL